MPYTSPSMSPSGLHSVLPVKSSSSYAGLANGNHHIPIQHHEKLPGHSHHSRPITTHHHRRSIGPTSPPRGPIPVATFVQEPSHPRRPSPVRRGSSSSSNSSDDEDNKRSGLHIRHSRDIPNRSEEHT